MKVRNRVVTTIVLLSMVVLLHCNPIDDPPAKKIKTSSNGASDENNVLVQLGVDAAPELEPIAGASFHPQLRETSAAVRGSKATPNNEQRTENSRPYSPLKTISRGSFPSTIVLNSGETIPIAEFLNYNPAVDNPRVPPHGIYMIPKNEKSKRPYNEDLYIERKYEIVSQHNNGAENVVVDNIDTPSLFEHNFKLGNRPFVAIYGNAASGKSVSLFKIYEEIKGQSRTWTYIHQIQKKSRRYNINNPLEYLFSNKFDLVGKKVFSTLLKKNPTKVNIFIDNIDNLPRIVMGKCIQYLIDLNKKGVGIVISSTLDLSANLPPMENMNIRRIPNQLTTSEKTLFLKKICLQKYPLAPDDRVQEYVRVLAMKLVEHEATVPQDFIMLKTIVDKLVSDRRSTFKNHIHLNEYIQYSSVHLQTVIRKFSVLNPLDKNTIFVKSLKSLLSLDTNGIGLERLSAAAFREKFDINTENQRVKSKVEAFLAVDNDIRLQDLLKFKYIKNMHAEYMNYLAAAHIINHLRNNDHSIEFFVTFSILLTDNKYIQLLEYMNIPSLVATDRHPIFTYVAEKPITVWNAAMDNAITHGFDHIALLLMQEMQHVSPITLISYFNPTDKHIHHELQSNSRFSFGMRLNTERTITSSRQGMLFWQNMIQSIEYIQRITSNTNSILTDINEFRKYLENHATLPNHSPELLRISAKLVYHEPFAKQLYDTVVFNAVKHRLLDTTLITSYLVELDVNPLQINVGGVSLLEIAAKTLNIKMIEFLVKKLHDPADISLAKESIFMSILDGNPLNQYSPPGFWRTIYMLLRDKPDFLSVPQPLDPRISGEIVIPTVEDKQSAVYKLVTATEDTSAAKELAFQLRLSPELIETLSPQLQNFRRNLILSRKGDPQKHTDRTTMTEILLKYRGLNDLTVQEQRYYENSVSIALRREMENGITRFQNMRISEYLSENLGTPADLLFAKKLCAQFLPNSHENMWDNLWNERRTAASNAINILPSTVESNVLPTRKDFFAKVIVAPEPVGELGSDFFEFLMDSSNPCGHHRRRRRALNCLITEAEFDEIVKVTKDEGKKSFAVVNVDKFLEQMDAVKYVNDAKYQQYRKMGEKLLNNQRTVLSGKFTDEFTEELRPTWDVNKIGAIREGSVSDFSSQQKNFPNELMTHGLENKFNPLSLSQSTDNLEMKSSLVNEGPNVYELRRNKIQNPATEQLNMRNTYPHVENFPPKDLIAFPHTFQPVNTLISIPKSSVVVEHPIIKFEPIHQYGEIPHIAIPEVSFTKLPLLSISAGHG